MGFPRWVIVGAPCWVNPVCGDDPAGVLSRYVSWMVTVLVSSCVPRVLPPLESGGVDIFWPSVYASSFDSARPVRYRRDLARSIGRRSVGLGKSAVRSADRDPASGARFPGIDSVRELRHPCGSPTTQRPTPRARRSGAHQLPVLRGLRGRTGHHPYRRRGSRHRPGGFRADRHVGSSCMLEEHLTPGYPLARGEELGYFEFGGCTHCLVFRRVRSGRSSFRSAGLTALCPAQRSLPLMNVSLPTTQPNGISDPHLEDTRPVWRAPVR